MKRRINKKAFITLVCSTSLIGVLTAGYVVSPNNFERKLAKAGLEISDDASYGGLNDEGFMKDFSLVDAGNYNNKISDESAALLNDTKKPTGVIIKTCAKDFCEIYQEVDYTKDLVRTFDVDCPICLDISDIFYSNSVSELEVNDLVNAYVDKLNANGLTVYVIGDDYVMNTIVALNSKDSENHVDYPIGLLWDYKTDGITLNYDLVITDKYIYSNKKFDNNLNNCMYFVEDFVYTANRSTSLTALGEEMGMSGEEIKRYNNISEYDNLDNKKIVIPNKYHKPYMVGVDISEWQGNIDFDKLSKAGVNFAIERAAYTYDHEDSKDYVVDTYFNHYSKELSEHGIIQGAYYYSTAFTYIEMDNEIELFLRTVEGHDIQLPLYIDIEGDTLKRLDNEKTRSIELDLINYFCERIKTAGYTPGIYIHKNYNKYLDSIDKSVAIWNCGGYYYDVEQSIDDMIITNALEDNIKVFQNTKVGNGFDLGADSQYICLDYADYDFVKTKKMN